MMNEKVYVFEFEYLILFYIETASEIWNTHCFYLNFIDLGA